MWRRAGAGAPRQVAWIAVLAAAAVLGAAAHAASSRSAARSVPPQPAPIDNRWSGYVVTAERVSFTRVSGTWTEPLAICSKGGEPALSTVWVGLGGYTTESKVLDQIGTDANCDAAGRASYVA
jgi:hypothetical protein